MIRAAFEADCLRDGYETSKRNLEPNQQNEAHAHGCDAGVFVLDGSVTLAFGESLCNCELGDTFSVPAGPCTRSTRKPTTCDMSPGGVQRQKPPVSLSMSSRCLLPTRV